LHDRISTERSSERVKTLSSFHSLPPPQSPGRLHADTTLGRLTLQDIPERSVLLEAYTAKKYMGGCGERRAHPGQS
jgi:hypothetical protein